MYSSELSMIFHSPHKYFKLIIWLILLQGVSIYNKSHAQVGDSSGGSNFHPYVPLTSFEYNNAPFKIGGPVNIIVVGNGFKAYFDIANSADVEISSLHVWLLVYFQDREKPVLYERTFREPIPPKSSRNFIWNELASQYGNPTAGAVVPYYIELSGNEDWYLSDSYGSNAEDSASPVGSNNLSGTAEELSPHHRSMRAVRVSEGPRLDGVLDDMVWQEVEFEGDFIQRIPDTGAAPSEKTEFAIIYDDKNVYFGVRMYESEPDKIRTTEMRRDERLFNDDRFEMVLDTFHDRQSGYNFIINAAGSRIDAFIREDGRIRNRDWDGVWDAKSSIDEKGWYLEITFPWQTLRYNEGDNLVWGANFMRAITRKNERDFWRFVPLYAGQEGQERISEGGYITGFNGLETGGNFDFKPFVTGGIQRDDLVEDELGEFGIDLKKSLTSTLTLDMTYNTDFAQVEADQEQVNLTRFDLFFPEKREFFLEGAGTFAFGQGTGGRNPLLGRAANIQLFHSRTIGLSDGNPVPIFGGARFIGRAGDYSLGVLSLQTDNIFIDSDSTDVPETNFSAFRLKRDIFSRSSVGVMLLNKEEMNGGYNRSLGFDSNFNVNENFSFFFVGAGTFSPGKEGKRNNLAGNAGFRFQSDLWQYNLSFLNIDKDFNPEMGFVRRKDIRFTEGGITLSPRFNQIPAIRQVLFTANGNYQTNRNNQVLNKKATGTFTIDFENTTNISFTVDREFEYLDNDFDIRPELIIARGLYTNTRYRGSFRSDRTKTISGTVTVNGGDFFTGTSVGGGVNTTIRAHPRVFASVSYNYNEIDLPEGQFHTNFLATRLSYAFSTDFFIKGFFQWVDDALLFNNRNQVSQNIILRYTYQPGSDFYLVYNQENLLGTGNDEISNRTLLAKFTYLLRK